MRVIDMNPEHVLQLGQHTRHIGRGGQDHQGQARGREYCIISFSNSKLQ
jgi:hypothetical protein